MGMAGLCVDELPYLRLGLETVRAQITGNSIQFFQRAGVDAHRRPAIGVHFEGHRRYRSRFDDLGGNRIAFERETPVMSVMTVDRTTLLPSGEQIPLLGQGTWHMAEDPQRRSEEIAALRLGIELGMTLIVHLSVLARGCVSCDRCHRSMPPSSYRGRQNNLCFQVVLPVPG
jgi:hypothetical protein